MTNQLSQKFIPIVLCAGLGTRLRPLTYCVPKVVAPLGEMPIAFTSIRTFLDAGFEQVHCNTHYLHETVEAELRAAMTRFGYDQTRLRCWHEPELLNSGGGIQRIWEELGNENSENRKKDVIVVSGDLYGKIPLEGMIESWQNRNANETTLFVTKQLFEDRSDVTWVDMNTNLIKGFGRDFKKEDGFTARNFTGQQIISSACLSVAKRIIISSVDLYYRAALARDEVIRHFVYDESYYWYNIGTYQEFLDAMQDPSVKGLRLIRPEDCLVVRSVQMNRLSQPTQSHLRVNTLRTCPNIEGKDLVTLLKELVLKQGTASYAGGGLNPSALILALESELARGLKESLAKPLLVPLELLNPSWFAMSPQTHQPHQPYLSSQTYLLV